MLPRIYSVFALLIVSQLDQFGGQGPQSLRITVDVNHGVIWIRTEAGKKFRSHESNSRRTFINLRASVAPNRGRRKAADLRGTDQTRSQIQRPTTAALPID